MLAIVLLVGCAGNKYHHYVKSPAPPRQALELVAARATAAGMKRSTTDVNRFVIAMPKGMLDGLTMFSGSSKSDPPPPPGKKNVAVVVENAYPTSGGTLLEITSTDEALLGQIHPAGETYRATDALFYTERHLWGFTVDAGYATTPATDMRWRIDTMGQAGTTVWDRGRAGRESSRRYRLSVMGGIGMAVDDAPRFRYEAGLVLDTQRIISPVGDRVIPQSRRLAASLTIAGLTGYERKGVEGGVALHVPPYGGVFARVGYETSERGSGKTTMVGVHFDTIPTLFVYGMVIVGVLAIGLSEADWEDLIDTKCTKNDPC